MAVDAREYPWSSATGRLKGGCGQDWPPHGRGSEVKFHTTGQALSSTAVSLAFPRRIQANGNHSMVAARTALPEAVFKKLRGLDTCTISNAIERLNGRIRNEGSISGSVIHCVFPNLPPMLGYAVTGRMRSTTQPVVGRTYHENIHWWRYVETLPEPRVLVVQDADDNPGAGALVGEMHAVIAMALNCVGYVTNGSVRDVPSVEKLGFSMFAGSVSVTHMYAHISQHGEPVEIGGLTINPGDLISGDRHGVQTIPLSIAGDIPGMAAEILEEESEFREFCQAPGFTVDRLEEKLRHIPGDGFEVPLDGG